MLVLLIICVVLLNAAILFFLSEKICFLIQKNFRLTVNPAIVFASSIVLIFCSLLILGVTGSSLDIGLSHSSFIDSDMRNIAGDSEPVRVDEYSVFTPLAIAQYNHDPQFPIHNTNYGENGQNMLIVGMTGVPVLNLSLVSKPATWGFFLFDLKRALSWHWFFPLFACMIALWKVFSLLLRGQWRISFLASLVFISSPYVTAWSNWPAYAVLFPCLILIISLQIIQHQKVIYLFFLSCLLGISFLGFFLVLYPPWQIPLMYLFLTLFLCLIYRDKLYKDLKIIHLATFIFSVLFFLFLLSLWWNGAAEAVNSIMETSYPGQRKAITGGTATLADFFRGVTNSVTLKRVEGSFTNQCEMASFIYYFGLIAVLYLLQIYRKTSRAIESCLLLLVSFFLLFIFVGLPMSISEFTLMSRVAVNRLDLTLGLINIMLCLLVLQDQINANHPTHHIGYKFLSVCTALFYSLIILSLFIFNDGLFAPQFSWTIISLWFTGLVFTGYLLLTFRLKQFLYCNLLWSVIAIFAFNPLNTAPKKIEFASNVISFPVDTDFTAKNHNFLVLSSEIPSMFLLAMGLHVVNGVFFYPQKNLWERLDGEGKFKSLYNRYQRLIFTDDENQSIAYKITSPYLDVVKVTINSTVFDFNLTGATVVIAPKSYTSRLRNNRSLRHDLTSNDWSWFRVIK